MEAIWESLLYSIALAIHSLDRTLHIAIALAIRFLDRSLHTRGRISIALAIHSLDRTLEELNPKGWCAGDFYRTRYPLA